MTRFHPQAATKLQLQPSRNAMEGVSKVLHLDSDDPRCCTDRGDTARNKQENT